MARFYSSTTRGFYDDRIHGQAGIPADAIGVTDEQHQLLLQSQEAGKMIAVIDGQVVAHEPPLPDTEEMLLALRRKRDRLLRESDFTQLPDAPLPEEQRETWCIYRQALRDLPQLYFNNPGDAIWPVPPAQI